MQQQRVELCNIHTLPDLEPSMLNMVGRDWGVASAVPAAMSAARDSTCAGGARAVRQEQGVGGGSRQAAGRKRDQKLTHHNVRMQSANP